MVRGVFITRSPSERMTFEAALKRYMSEVSTTKKLKTQSSEAGSAKHLEKFFGKYSLAAISSELVASYRDQWLAEGKANNTIRIELALLSHLFTIATKEWGLGITYNPVVNIRKPSPGEGRDRRLSIEDQKRLIEKVKQHSNPVLGWIVMIAIETGMRQSEILSLRKSNVDLKRRVVRLTDTKNDASRTVPLTRVATDTIQKAMDNPVRPSGLDLIFFGEPGKDGKRSPYQFKKIWGDIKTDLGFLDLHFHDLRHEAVKRNCNNNESEIKNACILMRTRPSGLLYY